MEEVRWKKVRGILDEALSLKCEDRPALLKQRCGADHALLADVESLLSGEGKTDSLDVTSTVHDSVPAPVAGMPRVIAGYRIQRVIGKGGMGVVYEAWEESMRRSVALKVLRSGITPSANEVARFEREAWIAGRLNHPNIVKIFQQGVDDSGLNFFAMQLVQGNSLAAEIHRVEADPAGANSKHIRRMISLFVDVSDALHHVHQNGILHRDIKPANLLLTSDGSRLMLTDFGIARDEESANLTRKGDFMGTIRYMSPEQLLAQRAKVDHRSDIYSLGVSLYEAVTLALPYSGETEEAYIAACSMTQPVAARERNRTLSRDLETVLMKCLDRDPDRRYSSAGELKEDLLRILQQRPVQARRPGVLLKAARFSARHRMALIATALCVALTAAGAMAWVRWSNQRKDLERVRWTLEQTLKEGTGPGKLNPDWNRLRTKLADEVHRHPDGEIAQLAMRAAAMVEVQAPPFGVLAQRIGLHLVTKTILNPKSDFVYIANYECALDEGLFKPIGSVFRHVTESSMGNGNSLEVDMHRFYSPQDLTPTPHQLRCRASLRFLRTASIPAQTVQEYERRGSADGAFEQGITLYSETRTLKSATINLIKEEQDFPRKVFPTAESGPPEKWLGLKSIRIIRLQLDAGKSGRCIAFGWPATKDNGQYMMPRKAESLKDPVVGFQLYGLMNQEQSFPISADATLLLNGNPKPLLSLPFVWAQNATDFSDQASRRSGDGPIEVVFSAARTISDVRDGTYLRDGTYPGHLRLVPSRSLALQTNGLDHYLGSELSIPLRVEIATVRGEWLSAEKCK